MKFSIELAPKDPLWRLEIYAHLAEKLGFDTLWISDHYHNRNVAVAISSIARVTRRVRIGPGVMNPYVTRPEVMAQIVATLSEIAPRRVCLGIGAGDSVTLEALNIRREAPLSKVIEAVDVVRRLLRGATIGDYVRLDFKPWGEVPIYVGAQGPKMLRVSAEVADGVLINASTPNSIEESVRVINDTLANARRSRKEFSVEAEVMISVDDERAKARKTVIPYIAFVAVSSPPRLLEKIGVNPENVYKLRPLLKARRWDDIQREMPEELIDYFSISGRPGEVRESLMELDGAGIDGVVLGGPLGPKPRRALIMLAEILRKR